MIAAESKAQPDEYVTFKTPRKQEDDEATPPDLC